MANEDEDFVGRYVPEWLKVLCVILHALTSVNGVFGSVLILISLSRNKFFRSATCTYSAYLANLVIVDVFFEAYHFPLIAVGLAVDRYPAVNVLHCKITGYIGTAAYSVYLLTLTAISFDRYMRVCQIQLYRKYFSRRTSKVVCLLIWFLGCLTPIPAAVNGMLGFDRTLHSCFLKDGANVGSHLPYLLVFLFSILASGFFSVKIFAVYWQAKHRVEQHSRCSVCHPNVECSTSCTTKPVKPSDIALLRTLLVIYFCLVLLVSPLLIMQGLRKPFHIPSYVQVPLLWLLSVNNSVDWIVYGLLHTRFREDFCQIMTTCGLIPCGGAAPKQTLSGHRVADSDQAFISATAIRVFAEEGKAWPSNAHPHFSSTSRGALGEARHQRATSGVGQ